MENIIMNKVPAFLRRSNIAITKEQLEFYNNYKFKVQSIPAMKPSKKIIILNRKQTKEKVYEMLTGVITTDSKMTKGALIKYVRDNWNEKTIMSDVGRVASKVINEKTGNSFSKWQICTTQRHIRKVK